MAAAVCDVRLWFGRRKALHFESMREGPSLLGIWADHGAHIPEGSLRGRRPVWYRYPLLQRLPVLRLQKLLAQRVRP